MAFLLIAICEMQILHLLAILLQLGVERHPYTSERENVRRLLKEARLDAGLFQKELAERLGKPQSFVSRYESGERRLDLPELEQICRELGLTLAEFLRRYEEATSWPAS